MPVEENTSKPGIFPTATTNRNLDYNPINGQLIKQLTGGDAFYARDLYRNGEYNDNLINGGFLMQLTGGDTFHARYLYQNEE